MTTASPHPDAPDRPLAGLVIVDKPYRLTSTAVVRVVKGRLRAGGAPKRVKVGHGGTLDPLATGVLVVLVGRATRLCDDVMRGRKGYLADIDLSRTSTTDDLEGELTPVDVPIPPERARIDALLRDSFTGTIAQTPPAYSAMKVGGKRAYDLARAGHDVHLEPRPVEIHAIRVVDYAWPALTLDIECGKGTYIRSLARDIGGSLGTGGVLTALRRTRVGRFTLDDAITLEALPDPLLQEHLTITPEVRALLGRATATSSDEPS